MKTPSKSPQQIVQFPGLGIGVQITRSAGQMLHVIVQSPSDAEILGDDLETAQNQETDDSEFCDADLRQWRHKLRNKLYVANLSIEILQSQLQDKCFEAAEGTLVIALQSYQELDQVALERPVHESRMVHCDASILAQSA